MRVRKETIKSSKEAIRQTMIHDLLVLGVTQIDGIDIHNLDYYTLRHKLAIQKTIME